MKRLDAALGGAAALFAVYSLTLAPGLTFWDAGEFIAAAHSLGIPHPPGTPLFVLLVNVWAKFLFFLPYAAATNLFSAAATALAAYVTARLVLRGGGDASMALAAALAAGGMSSVWLNATETEVYAASLALGVLMIWAGDLAGASDDERARRRWTMLTAYLMALAVPLHLSALVAAPVAIALAAHTPAGIDWRRGVMLAGVMTLAMGVGRMSLWMAVAGGVITIAARPRAGGPALSAAVVGLSALAFLYVRAQFDPAINQGEPDTFKAFADMVARRQYDVAPIWPRKAPLWVQFGNLGQYADWQVALSLGPTVMPSIARTLFTVVFLCLGGLGAVAHWKVGGGRRTFLAVAGLFLCGALGVLVYLNLHPGPSIGWGILPETTPREARERDYFYVFAFWAWGIWAGMGAIDVARRLSRPAWAGVLIACVPIVLNWRAVTRRAEPEQTLPIVLAEALLESTPRDGVLFVMGDNDSYPLWYAQQVRAFRRDVAVITVPLLPTHWYRSQIANRFGLLDSAQATRYDGRLEVAARIARGARDLRRPVAAAMTMHPRERAKLGDRWTASGLVYVEDAPTVDTAATAATGVMAATVDTAATVVMPATVDTVATRRLAQRVLERLGRRRPRESIDPVHGYFRRMLDCPRQLAMLDQFSDSTRLDSACNYR